MKSAKQFRELANEKCYPQIGSLAIITLIYSVLTSIITSIGYILGGKVETVFKFLDVLVTFALTGVFSMSFAKIHKKVNKNEIIKANDLFIGFKSFLKSSLLGVLISIYTLLWTLLFIIPGIVMTYAYKMSFYIASDNENLSAKECISRSKILMIGNKWRLFVLELSYIGWIILSIFTLGILLLWVVPKMQQASYQFYLEITGKDNEIEEEQSKEDAKDPFIKEEVFKCSGCGAVVKAKEGDKCPYCGKYLTKK